MKKHSFSTAIPSSMGKFLFRAETARENASESSDTPNDVRNETIKNLAKFSASRELQNFTDENDVSIESIDNRKYFYVLRALAKQVKDYQFSVDKQRIVVRIPENSSKNEVSVEVGSNRYTAILKKNEIWFLQEGLKNGKHIRGADVLGTANLDADMAVSENYSWRTKKSNDLNWLGTHKKYTKRNLLDPEAREILQKNIGRFVAMAVESQKNEEYESEAA